MIGIVTALRAKALAHDWDHHVWLLARTLDSILANTGNFRIFVACHDVPTIKHVQHPLIHFLSITAPIPTRSNDDMCVDKAIKLSAGSECAIRRGCNYIMFTDADDLVSNRVSAFVSAARHNPKGWYTSVEYSFAYGDFFIEARRVPANQCGSCVIVRSDLVDIATPPFSECAWLKMISKDKDYCAWLINRGCRVNGLAAVGHTDYLKLLAVEGHELEPLPFPANLKIRHYDSTSHVAGGIGSIIPTRIDDRPRWRRAASYLKHQCKAVPSLRFVTRSIKREFSVPDEVAPLHAISKTQSLL
jgi:hypothetical protein